MRLLSWAIPFLLFISCQSYDSVEEHEYEFKIMLTEEIKFPLDSLSSGIPSGISETFQSNSPNDTLFSPDNTYFQFNSLGNLLYYDTDTYRLIHKISTKGELLRGLGSVFGAYTLNSDSIYLFAKPFIGLIDSNGNLIDKFNYMTYDIIAEPIPASNSPFLFSKSKIIMGFYDNLIPPKNYNTTLESSELGGRVLFIDLLKKEPSFSFPFPDSYLKNKYYSRYYYSPTVSITNDKKNYLVSLGGDNYVYHTDFKDFTEPIYAGSSEFSLKVKSSSRQNEFEHYRLNYAYNRLIYDKYSGYTYRFLSIPKSEDQLDNPDITISRFKELIIIVLDENLDKIAETKISADFHDEAVFVTEKGLHIWNHKKTNIDEDNMYFGVFNVVKKDSQ